MQHVVVHRAGGFDRLRIERAPDPVPGAGDVRVRVAAAGVNYADCVVRMGLYASAKKYVGWPITPGFEFAGRVDALGAGVNDLAPGAEVFGVTRFGGYASHVVVPRHQLFARPSTLAVHEAAAFPSVFLTAWFALHELAAVRAGSCVLVHSAAGGVGGALVQLGVRAKCRVVGVVGASHKIAVARDAGAHVVIDKSRESLWRAAERASPEGYGAIFDANGASTLRGSYAHLAAPGRLVVYGFHSMLPRRGGRPNYLRLAWDFVRMPRFDPLRLTNENRSVMAFNLSYLFERRELLDAGMRDLLDALDRGEIRAPPVQRFPLAQVADVHRALESGTTVGKFVLEPDASV